MRERERERERKVERESYLKKATSAHILLNVSAAIQTNRLFESVMKHQTEDLTMKDEVWMPMDTSGKGLSFVSSSCFSYGVKKEFFVPLPVEGRQHQNLFAHRGTHRVVGNKGMERIEENTVTFPEASIPARW